MMNVLKYFVRVVMFLFPVLFFPIVLDAYGFGKEVVLLVLGVVGLILWLGHLIWEKQEKFNFNLGWLFFLLMTGWMAFQFFRAAPGIQNRAVTGSFGLLAMGVLTIWTWLWMQVRDEEESRKQLNWMTAGAGLVAVASVITFLIPASKLPIVWPKDNPILSINNVWSLTGSLLSEVVLMGFLAWEWGKRVILKFKKGENYVVTAVLAAVMILATGLAVTKIVKTGWVTLDGTTGWMIAVESFKRNPLTGAGVGNFIEAFNLYRPAGYNTTQFWTSAFNISTNGWLHVWTETGLVGLVLMVGLVILVLRQKKNSEWLRWVVLTGAFLFLPANLMVWWLLAWVIGSQVLENKRGSLLIKMGESGINGAPWIVAAVLAGLAVWSGIGLTKTVLADFYYRQSLIAMSKNDGGATYNLQIKAIALNPYSTDYRRMYSQTNLALAANLLNNKDISEDDKQKASTLVQQSIREGKAAVSLDQQDAVNWTNLAQLYRQLIGLVEGSADWSFQAYQQAMILDPTNPQLSLDLGGLLFAAGNYEGADRIFEQAVMNKNDYANAWYNWAYNAKKLNKLNDAVSRLTQAVALVPTTSGDYEKANEELVAWKKELDELNSKAQSQKPKETETLKTAEPLPTMGKEEKVNVPAEELQPPSPAATVMPTATPSVSVLP